MPGTRQSLYSSFVQTARLAVFRHPRQAGTNRGRTNLKLPEILAYIRAFVKAQKSVGLDCIVARGSRSGSIYAFPQKHSVKSDGLLSGLLLVYNRAIFKYVPTGQVV